MKLINLLPPAKQQELRYESLYHSIFTAAMMGIASLLAIALLGVGLGIYFQHQQKVVAAQIEQAQKLSNKEENAKLKELIGAINFQLKDYQDLSQAAPMWSNALRAFAADVPAEIKITSFQANSESKQVDINGYAPMRDQVIALYNKINEDKDHFRDINYPLENVARATEVDFHFTFFVQDKVLAAPPLVTDDQGGTK